MIKYLRKFRVYWLRDASFATLLAMLVLMVFVLPVAMSSMERGDNLLHVMLLFLFFVGIWSADTQQLVVISAVFFVLHLVLKIIRFHDQFVTRQIIEFIVAILNLMIFGLINLRLLFRDNSITFWRILGAINVYLIVALLGAFVLMLIAVILGESITGEVALTGTDNDFASYIYYSLSSLTTVGYGDIRPANDAARMFSVFLSSIGILFPAVIIARLVGTSNTNSGLK